MPRASPAPRRRAQCSASAFRPIGGGRILSINENDPLVLEPGMCFHYIPNCKFPYQGGVVFNECLAVTETGYELLSDFASEIFYK